MKKQPSPLRQQIIELFLIAWLLIVLYLFFGEEIFGVTNIIAFSFFYIFIKLMVFIMFNKKNKQENSQTQSNLSNSPLVKEANNPTIEIQEDVADHKEHKSNTVIASNVRFEGNLKTEGITNIYGEHHGNITAETGIINLMRGGVISGNVECKKLVVDGAITGECKADSIEVLANGIIEGVIQYSSISVTKGGILNGEIKQIGHKTNVVSLNAHAKTTKEKSVKTDTLHTTKEPVLESKSSLESK